MLVFFSPMVQDSQNLEQIITEELLTFKSKHSKQTLKAYPASTRSDGGSSGGVGLEQQAGIAENLHGLSSASRRAASVPFLNHVPDLSEEEASLKVASFLQHKVVTLRTFDWVSLLLLLRT